MSYLFESPHDLEQQVRDLARAEIDKALGTLGDRDEAPHEAVHDVRKKCKKIRGLVRLVRPPLGERYDEINVWFRDTARGVSDLRDAHVAIETLHLVLEQHGRAMERAPYEPLGKTLVERRDRLADEQDLMGRLETARDRLVKGREGIDDWSLEGDVDPDSFGLLSGGLEKTYRRFRKRFEDVLDEPSTETLHTWRKRAKYHRYHVRLLRRAWLPILDPWRDELHRLTDLLGDDHDLANLAELLAGGEIEIGSELRRSLAGAIVVSREELQRRSKDLGVRLAAEEPERLSERIGTYWGAWQEEGAGDGAMGDAAA